jgi:DNA/RNA endonuclease YhcR with UshA esterase domain
MNDKTLLKIALIVSLSGLLALYLLNYNFELNEKNVDKITIDNKDEFVKLSGTARKIVDAGNVIILELEQSNEIKVVLFKEAETKVSIKEGDILEVFGKVDEYGGQMEIIADRIRVIK